ncbi:MAG: KH domain-containing protein [Deltaproteobacteria bacterium]|nr:KH domain-containing protein [Deltaproteobacteria bacterium]
MLPLVTYLAKNLARNHPGRVEVREKEGPDFKEITIVADRSDVRHVIGKNGRIIRAIRTILAISSPKKGARLSVAVDALPSEPPGDDGDDGNRGDAGNDGGTAPNRAAEIDRAGDARHPDAADDPDAPDPRPSTATAETTPTAKTTTE